MSDNLLSIEKEMAYLKGILKGKGFYQSLMALQLAKERHAGQFRKSGEPYIMHPVRVCTTLLALGVYDDDTLAVALLHDVPEDCDVNVTELIRLGFNSNVAYGVDALTKKKGQSTESYYEGIQRGACVYKILPKLCDRGHNISTMAGAFNAEKIEQYVIETETYVYPLFAYAKRHLPQYSEQLFVMKYHLESLIKAYRLFLESIKEVKESDS